MTSIVSQGENRWRGNKTTFVIVYFKPAVNAVSNIARPLSEKRHLTERAWLLVSSFSPPFINTYKSEMHREKRSENHFAR